MLTGANLDMKRSLDGALVQISRPSQTQTSRQIASASVIGVTSTNGEKKEKGKTCTLQQTSKSVFSYYYHVKGGKKNEKEKQEEKKLSRAAFVKLE